MVYEVNLRQYTAQGTLQAFRPHLKRLADMGVGTLWFMPITPISALHRKGSLGSYYSVKDYKGINPEYGTIADFERMVDKAHSLGMYVIVDWVANHTAWDHPWVTQHPEWYTKDASGSIVPPVADWSDVADLNYDQPALRNEMIECMKYWVKEANIDGFRCDVAEMVPLDFWQNIRPELETIKPVFMLAEGEKADRAYRLRGIKFRFRWCLHLHK